MTTGWRSVAGVIYYKFLNARDTITREWYCHVLEGMHIKLRVKKPISVNRKGSILLYDIAHEHVLERTLSKLNELSYETYPCSPNSLSKNNHLF